MQPGYKDNLPTIYQPKTAPKKVKRALDGGIDDPNEEEKSAFDVRFNDNEDSDEKEED